MLWLAATAAASLSAPEPIKGRSWWEPSDVPVRLLQDEIVYYVGYALIVDPAGKILECVIEETSGMPALDRHACSIAKRRARLSPAIDSRGTTTFGTYRETTTFWMGQTRPKIREREADLDIALPRDIFDSKAREFVELAVAVDERGQPTGCGPRKNETRVQLVGHACNFAIASLKLRPVYDGKSAYRPSVQNVIVGVTTR